MPSLYNVIRLVLVGIILAVSTSALQAREEGNSVFLKMTHWEQCETSTDCAVDECCVSLRKSDIKICKRKPKLGNHCNPFHSPEASCTCSVGLTCALTALDNYGRHDKYQCVLVPEQDEEYEPRENSTHTDNQ